MDNEILAYTMMLKDPMGQVVKEICEDCANEVMDSLVLKT